MRKILVSLLALAAIFVLVGCTSSHVEHVPAVDGDHPLVGSWMWEETTNFIYIFNADGSGSRGFSPIIQTYSWEISEGGYLSMRMNSRTTELWDYEIVDDVLTLRSRQIRSAPYTLYRM
ncbi:MAG: hypothetical protein FWC89_10605 [Defluviitaleaceae bacterium]|nr:hypothetical protein [Defluviitaleaceae bacterium]